MSTQAIEYVVVGYIGPMLAEMNKSLPPGSVCVVEEADLIEARDLATKGLAYACVAEVIAGPAQRQDVDWAPDLPALATARAVIPAGEYVVVSTAVYAEAAGLPGPSVDAALILRHKGRLRQAADAAGVPQPAWAYATGVDDIAAFRAAHGGYCVLKPADRWASIGVQVLGPAEDLEQAWARRAGKDESMLRSASWATTQYLVEEYVPGPEVSVELIVRKGVVLFANVTGKSVYPGRHPVEAGHVVPAPIDAEVRDALIDANKKLIAGTGYGTGAIHSEWILADGVHPRLVECAGRLPGDAIVPLIDFAYGCSMLDIVTQLLRGDEPSLPTGPVSGAAVRFLSVPPGVVHAIHGVEEANAVEGVFGAGATVKVGDVVEPLACSWDRVGHVIALGADGPEAARRAEHAASLITYEMEALETSGEEATASVPA